MSSLATILDQLLQNKVLEMAKNGRFSSFWPFIIVYTYDIIHAYIQQQLNQCLKMSSLVTLDNLGSIAAK